MLISERRLRRFIRDTILETEDAGLSGLVEPFSAEEMGIDEPPHERKAGKWWQSAEKRQEFSESYVSGQNKKTLISTISEDIFEPETPGFVINHYYDHFILPQILYVINETWVVANPDAPWHKLTHSREERKEMRGEKCTGTQCAPGSAAYRGSSWSKEGSQEIQDPNRVGVAGSIFRGYENWILQLPLIGVIVASAGPIWATIFAAGLAIGSAVRWRRHVFGHELSHAIDKEVDLYMGIRWEMGYQNPKTIYRRTADPVEDPSYLPYVKRKGMTPGLLTSLMGVSKDIIEDIFPCSSPDHPDFKDRHHQRKSEIYATIIQVRKQLGREFSSSDIRRMRRGRGVPGAGDLIGVLRDCPVGSDQEIADALNRIG